MPHEETRSGRPRDPSRDEAILTATLDLLGEVGYDRVTVRAIAERAGVGLATMYRRWPSKDALVVAAVASYKDPTQKLRPGDGPAQNLRTLGEGLLDILQGARRGLLPTIVSQLQHNRALADTLRQEIVRPRFATVMEQIAALPGANPDRVEDATEMFAAYLFFQTLVLGRQLTGKDIDRIIETVTICATAP